MMIQEFEIRTGFYPTAAMYKVIEEYYYKFKGSKDDFCKAFKANDGGLAEEIRKAANLAEYEAGKERAAETVRRDAEVADLQKQIEKLKADLDRAEGWEAHEVSRMSQDRYEHLHSSGREMTDEEAQEYVAEEFGFAPDKVKILREIPTYQIDKDKTRIRKNGKVSRPPVYDATDWLYIRFNVRGNVTWQYEAVNGELYQYCD